MPIFDSYMPGEQPNHLVLEWGLNGEPLRRPLQIWYSSKALTRCKPINRVVSYITSNMAHKLWYGTVIALRFTGSRKEKYSDAGAFDLPALSAYFMGYR